MNSYADLMKINVSYEFQSGAEKRWRNQPLETVAQVPEDLGGADLVEKLTLMVLENNPYISRVKNLTICYDNG